MRTAQRTGCQPMDVKLTPELQRMIDSEMAKLPVMYRMTGVLQAEPVLSTDLAGMFMAAYRAGREDVLNAAADDLDAIAQRALQDGRENAGLDAYSGVKQVAAWLRARAQSKEHTDD
jgi:hypothetical protein